MSPILLFHKSCILILQYSFVARHEHLIGQEGVYSSMWKQQLESKEDASLENSLEKSTTYASF